MSAQLRSVLLVGVVLLVVGSVAYVRSQATPKPNRESASVPENLVVPATQPGATANADKTGPLPRVVDLGAKSCIPCKMMAPILEELKKELAGKASVEFIDVRENTLANQMYEVRAIPTQVFYDRTGKETWRHEGFLPKEQIVAKLREAGMQ